MTSSFTSPRGNSQDSFPFNHLLYENNDIGEFSGARRSSRFSFNLDNISFNHGFEPFSKGEKFMFIISFIALIIVLAGAFGILGRENNLGSGNP
ncbi:hypothetical protein NEOLI_000792 [Neolecta irregularis DAH-3]|uniref:Uncharacterized protein n=1 Tax=Neolecta irregularis (strain DAH-3) TaxID=1198029 RepID=A0A1U7LWT0_NEOID|nr:hypothetical protein NEOLI_000792 [Neolecta irregularis DAH-3]|eukprot:OLL27079.1 hypothetical protein NEOLI_000792 [Neolecta irregularis DAH-3]